jgi:RimJ/RimL family protein N-acetyltransferase
METKIELIAPEHIQGFHRALDLVSRERKYVFSLEAARLERTRQFVTNNIEKGFPQYVAIADGEVVGWCDVLPKPHAVHAHSGVLLIGIVPGWRGRGIGRALINETLHAARRLGLTRVELTVHADNAPAIALYKSVGFQQEGVLRDAVMIDRTYRDSIVMALVDRTCGQRTVRAVYAETNTTGRVACRPVHEREA